VYLADDHVHFNFNAHADEVVHLAAHDFLGEAELGDSVGQHSAGLVERLEDRHPVAFAAAVGRDGNAGRAAPDDGYCFARLLLDDGDGRVRLAHLPVRDEALKLADLDREVHGLEALAHGAGLLALLLLRADPPAHGRQDACFLDDGDRFAELSFGDELDEPGYVDRDRAALYAGLVLALEAALGLGDRHLLGEAQRHLVDVAYPLFRFLLGHLLQGQGESFLIGQLFLFHRKGILSVLGDARFPWRAGLIIREGDVLKDRVIFFVIASEAKRPSTSLRVQGCRAESRHASSLRSSQ